MIKLDFSNKTVLITGGTRGIGKITADLLFDSGANLILTGTNQNEIMALNHEAFKDADKRKKYLYADFSKEDSVYLFLDEINKEDKIDVCINNAGVNRINEFLDTEEEDYNWIMDINLRAPFEILKVVGRKMIENQYGRIVNIASIWSVITRPGRSIYTTSKNALVGLTKTLSVEWAKDNVLVNAVSPGFTLTELTEQTNSPEQLKEIQNKIPMKRMAKPIELAKVISFLCSEHNTYLTGQNITIDGGYTSV